MGFAGAAQANTVMINFQDHGTGDLGSGPITFTENGASITAEGFGPGNHDLYAKFTMGNLSETGLGLANDTVDHEILPGSFIQLDLASLLPKGSVLTLLVTGSIQAGESAEVFLGTTSGTIGSTPVAGNGVSGARESFNITATTGFLDITAGAGNILLDSVTVVTPNVPDGGTTIVLLGGAITALGLIRRKLMA